MSVSSEAMGSGDERRRLGIPIAHVRGAAAWSYINAFATYGILVLVLWVPFGPRNGMPYETTFPWSSETRSWLDGFIFQGDDLRPYTSVFYHLAYLIGKATGYAGSFVPYQLVYAALWWGRGVLVFLILAGLLGRTSLVAYLAGALATVHASDHTLNWVGQMNQFGMIFWLLLSIWFLVRSLLSADLVRAVLWCLGAMLAVRACLWSYESPLGIVLLVPPLLLLLRPSFRTRGKLAIVAAYLTVPVWYSIRALDRYVGGDSLAYQETVTRDDISLGQLASDLVYNVRASVSFWRWANLLPPVGDEAVVFGLCASAVVIIGGLVAWWSQGGVAWPGRRSLVVLAGIGAILLVASFPAYLILTTSRLLWRTQFLSGIGFGVLAAALIMLAASILPDRRARFAAALLGTSVVGFFGGVASYRSADFHYGIWTRHKHAIQEVLEAAPRVKPNTVIVYTDVPSNADPFGHTMWFDMALRLAYPYVPLAGIYYREGGRTPPGQTLTLRRGRWISTRQNYPLMVADVPLSRTLFIRYSTDEARTLQHVPQFLAGRAASARYAPALVIDGTEPDDKAERRYGPIEEEEHDG